MSDIITEHFQFSFSIKTHTESAWGFRKLGPNRYSFDFGKLSICFSMHFPNNYPKRKQ